jgi:acetoin utilization protein AcuB
MKIKDLMISDPITITEKTTIQEAIELMKDNQIRHVPVITKGNKLRGFVALSDLKQGLIPAMVGDISLSDLMIKDPIVVDPEDDIEIAALIIYRHKIGGMPVVTKGEVVGIITESDILRAFIDMMGLLTTSSRIDVVIGAESGLLRKALQIIYDHGGEIITIGLTSLKSPKRTYYFRLSPIKTEIIKDALEREGFEVVAAMD